MTLFAVLASMGIVTTFGMWVHFAPAALIYSAGDAMGVRISSHGPIVGSAHGPPFLEPVGVFLLYVLPTLAFALAAIGRRRVAVDD